MAESPTAVVHIQTRVLLHFLESVFDVDSTRLVYYIPVKWEKQGRIL
jgi:hypothetical protein